MNSILEVNLNRFRCSGWSTDTDYVEIKHSNGFLYFGRGQRSNYYNKILSSKNHLSSNIDDKEKMRVISDSFKKFEEYSKNELEEFQRVNLFAYVYSHILIDTAISESKSKIELEVLKEKLTEIRRQLKDITIYIDDYENLLNNFKQV
ncbi:hypothetical protein [Cyclobacterium sp. SYSU L10401]|uniref:hypothetical protein n=1 Tax=Cyclobacterium sp. SYSU L10401 TaxID=2678657 RepID=UPI0013D0383B|nr:hypothetical protein [Cyclobacterium sp. SYSU L10401]